MIPDGRTTISYQPNIRPAVTPHSKCWQQDWQWQHHRLGDVRRCPHGKVQVLTEIGPAARVAGPGTHWWRTLSPVFTPFLFRRARAALGIPDD